MEIIEGIIGIIGIIIIGIITINLILLPFYIVGIFIYVIAKIIIEESKKK